MDSLRFFCFDYTSDTHFDAFCVRLSICFASGSLFLPFWTVCAILHSFFFSLERKLGERKEKKWKFRRLKNFEISIFLMILN